MLKREKVLFDILVVGANVLFDILVVGANFLDILIILGKHITYYFLLTFHLLLLTVVTALDGHKL